MHLVEAPGPHEPEWPHGVPSDVKEPRVGSKALDEALAALFDAIDRRAEWHVVHFLCIRLSELLHFRFAVEESLMRLISYPRLSGHRRAHRAIAETVEQLREASLQQDYVLDAAAISAAFESYRAEWDRPFANFFSSYF